MLARIPMSRFILLEDLGQIFRIMESTNWTEDDIEKMKRYGVIEEITKEEMEKLEKGKNVTKIKMTVQ